MTDDKKQSGGQDHIRINSGEDYELRDWATKFSVSVDELKAAIAVVGNNAADVEAHLAQKN